ncbi:MAG: sugar ABC transporter permease [Chloroflexi bacterium]|nr:sugar ABC transporter permease [Chloroflexota bacterium]
MIVTRSAGRARLWATVRSLRPRLLTFLLVPVLLNFTWMFYILGLEVVNSLQHYNLAKPWVSGFAGLENYRRLFDDELFWLSLNNTVVWTIGNVIPQLVLGMALAFLLNEEFAFRGLYRSLALSPWAVSATVGAMMWAWMLHGPFGVFNDLLIRAGLGSARIAWLSSPDTAMYGVIIANVWRGVPFFTVTILAGLQAMSDDIYEAAAIDGADGWRTFWYITLPLLKGVIAVTVLLRTVWTFNWVETIFAMTGGGPGNATLTMALLVFNQFFRFSDVGYASAMAVLLFALLMVFTLIYLRLFRLDQGEVR